MWKESLSFLEAVSSRANIVTVLAAVIAATTAVFSLSIVAATAGTIAAVSAFISWFASKKASDIIRRESEERIAAAEGKAAGATEKAEQERLARLRIEKQLAPRSLSRTGELVEKLKPFEGTSIIIRGIFEGGPDVVPLTNQIIWVFQTAKWKVTIVNLIASGEHVDGIIVAHSEESDDNTIAAANLLIDALSADGIDASHKVSIDDVPNTIRVVIGSKP